MKTINFSVSPATAAFGKLTSRKYDSKYYQLVFSEQPKGVQSAITLLTAIFGQSPEPELVIGSVRSNNGGYERMYGPVLCKSADGKVILKLGSLELPVTKSLFKEYETELNGKKATVEASIKKFEISGPDQDEDFCLNIAVFLPESDQIINYYFGILFVSYEKEDLLTVDEYQALAKRDHKTLVQHLADAPTSDSDPTLKLSNLEDGSMWTVVGYRGVTTDGRTTYLLKLAVSGDDDYLVDPASGSEDTAQMSSLEGFNGYVNVWSNKNLAMALSFDPVINPDTPATLSINGRKIRKDNKVNVYCNLVTSVSDDSGDDLDFDF